MASDITSVPTLKSPKAFAKVLKSSTFVLLKTEYPLAEPLTLQRFHPNQVTETPEITPWIQAQIDAGIMEEVQNA